MLTLKGFVTIDHEKLSKKQYKFADALIDLIVEISDMTESSFIRDKKLGEEAFEWIVKTADKLNKVIKEK